MDQCAEVHIANMWAFIHLTMWGTSCGVPKKLKTTQCIVIRPNLRLYYIAGLVVKIWHRRVIKCHGVTLLSVICYLKSPDLSASLHWT